jgi:starvation-inducible DNA-binding protein
MTSGTQRLEPRDIDIAPDDRAEAGRYIDEVLAQTYKLMIETQILHWNVKGPLFLAAHNLSEEHYKDMFAAVDVIAERNRALGQTSPAKTGPFPPPARFSADQVLSEAAIGALVEGHEELVKLLREAASALDEGGDAATADFFIDRLAFHEKAVWMWRALAGSSGSTV